MGFGDKMQAHMGKCSKEATFEILDTFVAAGGNFRDTANDYQHEQSEQWLGEWMTARKNRDSLVLSTKYGSAYKIYDQATFGCQSNWGGGGTKAMKKSLDDSLSKLQTTYVDVFYLHFWDYSTTVPELMHSLNDLVVAGKVHYLGISDTPAWVVNKANQYARGHGLRLFVVYQGFWNAGARDLERVIIPMCHDEGMGICPWGTIGQSRFQTATAYTEREINNPGRVGKAVSSHDKAVAAALGAVAQRKGSMLANVAVTYCFAKALYVFPVVGIRKLEHLKANIAALTLRLSEKDVSEVEDGYEFSRAFRTSF